MEWIKCSDRTPTNKEYVAYVYANGEIKCDGIFFDQTTQSWMEDYGMDYYGPCKRNVTHWMLKPEPPKEF